MRALFFFCARVIFRNGKSISYYAFGRTPEGEKLCSGAFYTAVKFERASCEDPNYRVRGVSDSVSRLSSVGEGPRRALWGGAKH